MKKKSRNPACRSRGRISLRHTPHTTTNLPHTDIEQSRKIQWREVLRSFLPITPSETSTNENTMHLTHATIGVLGGGATSYMY